MVTSSLAQGTATRPGGVRTQDSGSSTVETGPLCPPVSKLEPAAPVPARGHHVGRPPPRGSLRHFLETRPEGFPGLLLPPQLMPWFSRAARLLVPRPNSWGRGPHAVSAMGLTASKKSSPVLLLGNGSLPCSEGAATRGLLFLGTRAGREAQTPRLLASQTH